MHRTVRPRRKLGIDPSDSMMPRSHRWRVLSATLISLLPFAFLRRGLLRIVLGYEIDSTASIDMLAVIAVDKASIGPRVRIGRFTKFSGPFELIIEERARIGPSNVVACGDFAAEEARLDHGYARRCHIGRRALITSNHFIDASGGFSLGEHAWIAGRGSQFWTHGAIPGGHPVSIGERTYVGAAVRFAPGASVGSESLVSLGAVVTKAFAEPRLLIGGVPAKVIRENIDPVWPAEGGRG